MIFAPMVLAAPPTPASPPLPLPRFPALPPSSLEPSLLSLPAASHLFCPFMSPVTPSDPLGHPYALLGPHAKFASPPWRVSWWPLCVISQYLNSFFNQFSPNFSPMFRRFSAFSFRRGEQTPTPKISALLRKRPVLQRANFVLTKNRKRPYYRHFCGKIHREGSCSKAAGGP